MLEAQISHICKQFLNDIGVKGPRTDYSGVEALSSVWGFILKYIQNLDRVLYDLERAGLTVAEAKSQWCMSGIGVVGFICDLKGHHPDSAKVLKIVE